MIKIFAVKITMQHLFVRITGVLNYQLIIVSQLFVFFSYSLITRKYAAMWVTNYIINVYVYYFLQLPLYVCIKHIF